MWAKDNRELVPNATRHADNGAMWERRQLDGFIHIYSGAWHWRWYVVRDGRSAISPQVFRSPAPAMKQAQKVYDAMRGAAETIECVSCCGNGCVICNEDGAIRLQSAD